MPTDRERTLTRVSVDLTAGDLDNLKRIQGVVGNLTGGEVVSAALELARFVVEQKREGAVFLAQRTDGGLQRVHMRALEPANG